jgi:hypothetical protein
MLQTKKGAYKFDPNEIDCALSDLNLDDPIGHDPHQNLERT